MQEEDNIKLPLKEEGGKIMYENLFTAVINLQCMILKLNLLL